MCGAYGFLGTSSFGKSVTLLTRFQLENNIKPSDGWNIRPSMKSMIVTRNSPNKGVISTFGFYPAWSDKMMLINAKSETIAQLPTYKKMFRESRCLVPASYFFEWQKQEGMKQPYCIKVKDENVFSFAGLYNEQGFVIITTTPNELMEPIHNRMPVILTEKEEDEWLNPDAEEDRLLAMLTPFPADKMEAYPVSSLVNSAKIQSKEVILPAKPLKEALKPSQSNLFE